MSFNHSKVEFPSRYRQIRREQKVEKIKQYLTKIVHYVALAVGIGLVATAIYYPMVSGLFAGGIVEEEPSIPKPVEVIEPAEEVKKEVQIEVIKDWTQEEIIEEINNTFPDAPIMVAVAKCEGFVNGRLDPEAYNPTNNSHDRGILQISDKYHKETYTRLGFDDMHDVEQNLAYGRILYDQNGLRDWSASYNCWSQSPHYRG